MIRLILLNSLLFLSSCILNSREEYSHSIKLINNRGIVKLNLPVEFDTAFSWHHMSDHGCGDYQKYRIQNSSNEIKMENGWFWIEADTMNRLTISHFINTDCFKQSPGVDTFHLDRIIESEMERDNQTKIKLRTIEKINNRTFAILGYSNRTPLGNTYTLVAITPIDSMILNIKFENNIENNMHSIDSMYKYLKSVNIE